MCTRPIKHLGYSMSAGKVLVLLTSLAFAGFAAAQSASATKDIQNIQDALSNAGTKAIFDPRLGLPGSPFKCTGDLR